jgi:hypothetical protein
MSVSELLERLEKQILPSAQVDWNRLRKDIVEEHKRATTTAERVALLGLYNALMDMVERDGGFTPEDKEVIKKTRREEYCLLLIKETLVDELVDPQKLEEVTRREIEAGRMTPDDDLRKLAVDGPTIPTPLSSRPEQEQQSKPDKHIVPRPDRDL